MSDLLRSFPNTALALTLISGAAMLWLLVGAARSVANLVRVRRANRRYALTVNPTLARIGVAPWRPSTKRLNCGSRITEEVR